MIKYKDIVYSKKAPEEHNVLWIKAGKYVESLQNPEEDKSEYPGSKLYQFVDGNWRSVNNADDTADYISGIKEDIVTLQSETDNIKESITSVNNTVTTVNNTVTTLNNSVNVLSDNFTTYKGTESSLAIPVIQIDNLHELSMDTVSITRDIAITPTITSSNKWEAVGRAIYYYHVPYIIITNTLSGNTQTGVPCKLDFTSTNFAFKTNYSQELRPTYITETTIDVGSSVEHIQKRIKVEFYSVTEIEANASLNKVIVTLID